MVSTQKSVHRDALTEVKTHHMRKVRRYDYVVKATANESIASRCH